MKRLRGVAVEWHIAQKSSQLADIAAERATRFGSYNDLLSIRLEKLIRELFRQARNPVEN